MLGHAWIHPVSHRSFNVRGCQHWSHLTDTPSGNPYGLQEGIIRPDLAVIPATTANVPNPSAAKRRLFQEEPRKRSPSMQYRRWRFDSRRPRMPRAAQFGSRGCRPPRPRPVSPKPSCHVYRFTFKALVETSQPCF